MFDHFRPHSMKDMKLSNFTQGDERYYNNLLVGPSGLPNYGKAANIQAAGNVFLKGLGIQMKERADGFWLNVPLDPAEASAQNRSIVTTELLGKAKVPDAPFENPDGTPYRLDTDYFGKKRNPENPAPGPFAAQGGKEIHLKVWPKK